MGRFKVISFDMFQTLVDVNARKHEVWREILKQAYTEANAEAYWRDTLRKLGEYTKGMKCGKEVFQPMRKTFLECYRKLFEENAIDVNPALAVDILFREHGNALIYPDAKEFFDQLNPSYRIWISSDTDRQMILPLLPNFPHEYAFFSEDIGVYKQDHQYRFFKYILETTKVEPKQILHVGDGLGDILGAKGAGIVTCWINRQHIQWEHHIKPDFIIHSLSELKAILSQNGDAPL